MKLVSSFAHPFYRSSTRLTAVTRKLNFSTQYGLARSLMASSIVLGPHHTRQFDPTLSNIGASLWAAYSSSSGAQAGYSGLDIIKTTDTEPAVFQAESEEVFDMLMDRLEADDVIDRDDLEVDCTSDGVMNIKISAVGTWVINKHSATKQIWLSSPVSGPFKYNYWAEHPHGVKDSETHWLGERDEHSLHDRLRGELRDSLGIDTLDFERVF